MDHVPKDVALQMADVLRKELKQWHYHQQFDDGVCRIFFIKEHAMLCVVVDHHSMTVNSNWDTGCSQEKYCKITPETMKKVTEGLIARSLFVEELKHF
jgi:hypothetical protein